MTTCLIFSLRFCQIRLKVEPTMISTRIVTAVTFYFLDLD